MERERASKKLLKSLKQIYWPNEQEYDDLGPRLGVLASLLVPFIRGTTLFILSTPLIVTCTVMRANGCLGEEVSSEEGDSTQAEASELEAVIERKTNEEGISKDSLPQTNLIEPPQASADGRIQSLCDRGYDLTMTNGWFLPSLSGLGHETVNYTVDLCDPKISKRPGGNKNIQPVDIVENPRPEGGAKPVTNENIQIADIPPQDPPISD